MMSTNGRGYRVAAWVGQALLTIAVIAALTSLRALQEWTRPAAAGGNGASGASQF